MSDQSQPYPAGIIPTSVDPQSDRTRQFATAAAATGIVGLLTLCTGGLGLVLAAIAGIVFGILGLKNASGSKGLAITGIIASALLLLVCIAVILLYGAVFIAALADM